MSFKNYNESYVTTNNIINPTLIAGTDESGNQRITFNIQNNVTAQYQNGSWNPEANTNNPNNPNTSNPNLAYLNSLKSQISPENLKLEPINLVQISNANAVRGLTDVGTATVAIAIAAASLATGGAAAGVWVAMGSAVATTAATIATTTAINASMNAEGDIWKQAKDLQKVGWESVTTREALEQMAIAAITAGVTQGATNGLEKAGYIQKVATNADAATRFTTNLGNASIKLTVGAAANALSTTLVQGISGSNDLSLNALTDNLKTNLTSEDAAKSILIRAFAESLAMEIGHYAHSPELDSNGKIQLDTNGNIVRQIDKSTQLTLHAALGCGLGIAQNGSGGCAGGAAAGVIGELTADNLYQEGRGNYNRNQAIAGGQVSGALAAMFTSLLTGQGDSETARNMYSGSFIGGNAAANNATYVSRRTGKVLADDGQDDKKVILVGAEEELNLISLYLKQKLPLEMDRISSNLIVNTLAYEEKLLSSSTSGIGKALANLSPSNAIGTIVGLTDSVALVSPSYQLETNGTFYDLTNRNDFTDLAKMTGASGISYSDNILNMMFGSNQQTIDTNNNILLDMVSNNYPQQTNMKTNIFLLNGMSNNIKSANESGKMLEQGLGRPVGLIINSTGGIDDVTEFLPNQLYLKDVLTGEVLQQIGNNGYNNLIFTHSAGNEDILKAAAMLSLKGINLNGNVNVMSVGSPVSQRRLEVGLNPVGINLLGQYNTLLDPITQSKAWVAGTLALAGAAAVYGAGAASTGSGLQAYMSGLVGGGVGGGVGLYLLSNHHPLSTYYQKNIKNLAVDSKNWAQENPLSE